MYYKIKLSKEQNNKRILETYLTDATNFAEAAENVISQTGIDIEIEDICLMKAFKPAANDYYDGAKIFAIKVAEDMLQDDGTIKTIKYALPVFAKTSDEVHKIINDYIKQGLENMRLTTISETKWIWV